MAENSKIEWTDHTDPRPTGRRLGVYKQAAKRTGCTLDEWMAHRLSGRKWCFRCRTWQARAAFSIDRSRGSGQTSSCKACTSTASTASRYGMSIQELRAFRDRHGNRCGVCGDDRLTVIDHDHKTERPRGLLCPNCNSAIGKLKEDPALFAAAVEYLRAGRLLDGREWNEVPCATT